MEDEDVKVIKNREQLRDLSECPCSGCIQQEGCPAPEYCERYSIWKKARKKKYGKNIPPRS